MNAIVQPNAGPLWVFAAAQRPEIDAAIQRHLPTVPWPGSPVFDAAVRHAAFPGGKRLRPVLTMLGSELFGRPAEDVMHAAVAVEFVHISSLIFDDLPCMDDADERRGRPSVHARFGEGVAVLAGVAFLNAAYALVPLDSWEDDRLSVRKLNEVVDCVGPGGMIAGQAIDLSAAADRPRAAHDLKTSALIRLALRLGAIHAGADEDELIHLSRFAALLGEAYQISDDIADVREDAGRNGTARHLHELLAAAVGSARRTLTDNFAPCEARECLSDLVRYVAQRAK